jgi:hypothetical protein
MKTFRLAASGPMPKRTHSRRVLLGVSATTYLALCVWLGPNIATFLIVVVAIGAVWFWFAGRFPRTAWVAYGFLRGLFGR